MALVEAWPIQHPPRARIGARESEVDSWRGHPSVGQFEICLADAIEWLDARPENSIHAIVTDPPYGLKEYTHTEQAKLRNGRGGVWRIPPSFDGCKRSPLPRFTVLDKIGRAHV